MKKYIGCVLFCVIFAFILWNEKQSSRKAGYEEGILNGVKYAQRVAEGMPTNIQPLDVSDEDVYENSLEIIKVEDAEDKDDGFSYFKTTVLKKDGGIELYCNKVRAEHWELVLLRALKRKFSK